MKLSCRNPAACSTCYATHVLPNRPSCRACGKRVSRVDVEGTCPACRRKKRLCERCGSFGSIHESNGLMTCRACYAQNLQARKTCSECGKARVLRTFSGGRALCSACYMKMWMKRRECSICGIVGRTYAMKDGQPVCGRCKRGILRKHAECELCGRIRPVSARRASGLITCDSCYSLYLMPQRVCAGCGRTSRIVTDELCPSCFRKSPAGRASSLRSNLKRRGAESEVSAADWLRLMRMTGWRCFYCGTSISSSGSRTIDHVVPMSGDGTTEPLNLVPCCRICNSSKGTKPVLEWLVENGLELATRKTRRICRALRRYRQGRFSNGHLS
jgi:hypothetical protein